jgi:lysophospholipid acyltransferase (LPLAT)-like uncharacterized protein
VKLARLAPALPLLALAGRGALRGVGATLRRQEVNRPAIDALWAAGGPLVYAVWHGRMLLLPYWYGRVRRPYALASRSRDGEVVRRFVEGFGVRVVRGSSSRGGAIALRVLARLLRRERAEVVLVPDGPRGPREVAQPGAVLLAKLSGAPVIPVGVGFWPRTVLGTWDAFVLPHPFARAAVVWGEPIRVRPDADEGALDAARAHLERALRAATAEADRVAGVPAPVPDVSAV